MDPELAEVCSLERRLLDPAVRGRPDEVRVAGLEATLVAPGVALLIYATAASKRSSLWVRGDDGWQVRFHQGTPT